MPPVGRSKAATVTSDTEAGRLTNPSSMHVRRNCFRRCTATCPGPQHVSSPLFTCHGAFPSVRPDDKLARAPCSPETTTRAPLREQHTYVSRHRVVWNPGDVCRPASLAHAWARRRMWCDPRSAARTYDPSLYALAKPADSPPWRHYVVANC